MLVGAQAWAVAVAGSYAYVTGGNSDSLAVIDISNPASPSIVGSVSDSSVMDGVRCGWRPPLTHAPVRRLPHRR